MSCRAQYLKVLLHCWFFSLGLFPISKCQYEVGFGFGADRSRMREVLKLWHLGGRMLLHALTLVKNSWCLSVWIPHRGRPRNHRSLTFSGALSFIWNNCCVDYFSHEGCVRWTELGGSSLRCITLLECLSTWEHALEWRPNTPFMIRLSYESWLGVAIN